MLFALDWIWEQLQTIKKEIAVLFQQVNLERISEFMTSSAVLGFFCAAGAIALCVYGFRIHKLISGIVGAGIMGRIGYVIGNSVNHEYKTVSVLYMVIFGLFGFVFLYACYQMNIIAGALLLFYALCKIGDGYFSQNAVGFSVILSVVYCILFVTNQLIMSSVTGGIIWGLLAYAVNPAAAVIVGITVAGGSIPVHFKMRQRYFEYLESETAIDKEKYPYGPGLVYGWEEPRGTGSYHTKKTLSKKN